MVGFHQRVIPEFLTVREPLFRLCRGEVSFVCSYKQDQAFKALKEAQEKALVLQFLSGIAYSRLRAIQEGWSLGLFQPRIKALTSDFP